MAAKSSSGSTVETVLYIALWYALNVGYNIYNKVSPRHAEFLQSPRVDPAPTVHRSPFGHSSALAPRVFVFTK